MLDTIKKTLLAGVGAAIISKERAESLLGEFVQQGKVSSAEARQMAEKIAAEGRREFETMSDGLSERLHDMFNGAESKMLERLAAIEVRLKALEEAAVAAAKPAAAAPRARPSRRHKPKRA